jgi:DNA-binding NarL/FixJ family response regulator
MNESLMKLRILIVDDIDMMRVLVTQYLSKNDDVVIVGEACDGEEAVKKSKECSPDVIIMDISLPDIDGVALSRRIKAILPTVRIYLCSAYPVEEYRALEINSSADGFIQKSSLKLELLAMINKEVNRRKIVKP